MGHYSFRKDLSVSEVAVKEVSEVLLKYNIETIESNDDYRFDLLVRFDGRDSKIEVKEDFLVYKWGNVAVEYESRNKPSGISTTEAVCYIYKTHEKLGLIRFYIIRTDTLREMIRQKLYVRIVENSGDKGSNTKNYLFALNDFQQYSDKLHEYIET